MSFYITTDTKSSKIYVSADTADADHPYLILCDHMGEAESLMRKLNYKGVKSPLESDKDYQLLGREEIIPFGVVFIYQLK